MQRVFATADSAAQRNKQSADRLCAVCDTYPFYSTDAKLLAKNFAIEDGKKIVPLYAVKLNIATITLTETVGVIKCSKPPRIMQSTIQDGYFFENYLSNDGLNA